MCDDASHEGTAQSATFDEALVAACTAIGLSLNRRQRELMLAHFQRVVEANRHFNLTRITSPADAAVKHYADSLTLLAAPWIDAGHSTTLLDVGTGAGFPAVPLAIMCPKRKIMAIDGTGKKARFVAETVEALGLRNLHARQARARELAAEKGGRFDLVLVRAVGKIAEVLREVHQVVEPGGQAVFYKTDKIEPAEVSAAVRTASMLGLSMGESFDIELPSPSGPLRRRLVRFGR